MTTEAQRKASRNWARTHKDKVNARNKEWRQANKEKWNKISVASRKKRAQILKEKGMIYTYLPRTQRELKTINYLCEKLNINEDEARRLLIDNEWNVKKILGN